MQRHDRTRAAFGLAGVSVLALLFCCGVSRADEPPNTSGDPAKPPEKGVITGRLGLGAIAFPAYSGGSSYRAWPVPLADIEIADVAYVDYWQAGLYVAATADKRLGLAIIGSPRAGFKAGDNDHLAGMMNRKDGLDMGLSVDYALGPGGISLGYLHDVTGASRGGVWRLVGGRRFELSERFGVDAFLEAEWQSARVANYYSGIGANEATPARPFFQPGSDTDLVMGLHFNYDFGSRSTILFGYEGTWLGSSIANSPIVESRLNNLVYVGYGWRFR